MDTFEFIRPPDSAGAVATAAQAKTAQQGADVRFVAGGTTLLDLMKLNVETPARVIDINRLPLDMIEATPEGGLMIGATVVRCRHLQGQVHEIGLKFHKPIDTSLLRDLQEEDPTVWQGGAPKRRLDESARTE